MSLTLLGAGQVGRAFVKIAAGQQQEALRVIDTRPPEDTVAFLSRDSQYPRAGYTAKFSEYLAIGRNAACASSRPIQNWSLLPTSWS